MGCKWLAGLVWRGWEVWGWVVNGQQGLVSRIYLYVDCTDGLGLGCEQLAGLAWEGPDCVGFVYKIVEIMAASSNGGGGRVLGLLCVEWNRVDSNLAVHFHFFFSLSNFLLSLAVCICIRSHLCRNRPGLQLLQSNSVRFSTIVRTRLRRSRKGSQEQGWQLQPNRE